MAIAVRFVTSIDQRFPASLEKEFKRSLEAVAAMPIYLAAVLSMVVAGWSQCNMGYDVADPLVLFLCYKNMGIVVLAAFVVLTVASRGWLARRLFHVDLEFLVLAVGTVGLAATSFGGMRHAAQIFGRDPAQTFGHRSEASEVTVVMVVNIVSTASCLFMPIRSHLMWVLPTVGICMLSLVTLSTSAPHPLSLLELLFYVSTMSGFSVFAGYRNESHIRKEWLAERQVVKPNFYEKQRQAFTHLLDLLCDCLLHLGPNLEIMEPCPKLASMLGVSTGTSLQGNNFCDFILRREDQDRFIQATDRGTSEEDHAGILPLHFRAVGGGSVQVHVFYTSFHGQDDAPYHIVGVVEAGAQEGFAQPAPDNSFSRTIPRVEVYPSPPDIGDSASESRRTLESLSGSELGEISITFEGTPGLAVISCTPGFRRLCGPCGDSSQLIDWLVDKDSFQRVVQNYVNMLYNAPLDFGNFVLRTPNAASAGIEYVIDECTVDAISTVFDDSRSDKVFALRLRFDDVHQRRCKEEGSTRRKVSL